MSQIIGITGSKGFVGSHLDNYLRYVLGREVITYDVPDFADELALESFVQRCDTIVHLAAVNRDVDEQRLHDTNVRLVQRLIDACLRMEVAPSIIFSSSTHIKRDSLYAQSKRKGMQLLEAFAKTSGARVANLVIPNVFGPFAQPNYNTVVATFCDKLIKGETPVVVQDAELELIYVNELVADIAEVILSGQNGEIWVEGRHHIKVTVLAERLAEMHTAFAKTGTVPDLADVTNQALFNTYYCYRYAAHQARQFVKHNDERGSFIEVIRSEGQGQFSYSTTVPGVTRGNHFHTRKAERFAVIQGEARIDIRRVGQTDVRSFALSGTQPAWIDMPIWHTHNITNTGTSELVCLFWISEPYDTKDADTFFLHV